MAIKVNSAMRGFKSKFGVTVLVVISIGISLASIYGMLKPVSNGCIMTYMYPTYIPISSPKNLSSAKYGLYLYHEGWQKIDFNEHLKQLSGNPVLFIPGNGGSYKQVRSLAAESDRAHQGGPLEHLLYQEASLTPEEGGVDMNVKSLPIPTQYSSTLDWFAVDLEGEHSAMDGQILEEHTEYVVYAIHRILDQYKESRDAQISEGVANSGILPRSVILVGHSMGGFVARAATVHPHLRKSAVETVLTLSTPHQSPPVALQPSLGHYYAHVNEEWRKGYEIHTSRSGNYVSGPQLSRVVVVSISGGIHDYQVRTKLESLDAIVPPTNGFMISSTSMQNVWLSMEHQVILWCNQVVVQVSHTLLSLIESETGQPFSEPTKRLAIFARMLRSGVPDSWFRRSHLSHRSPHAPFKNQVAESQVHTLPACPSKFSWSDTGLERDLYIQTTTVTVLAMDGRRRWLDIKKLGSSGKSHFLFVTNLLPCFGVRLYLWPEKGNSDSDSSANKRVVEVTSKLVKIPSGPAPRQVEPGSQTEQAPPSAVFWLAPEDMYGFRFLTISVAPRPAFSGRPPPATSMAVGQFFDPDDGKTELSPHLLLRSMFTQQDMALKEDHPLALDLLFGISLGLLPVKVSLEPTGCGIQKSGLPDEEVKDMENSKLCKLRCFPPVALSWDTISGLHISPNLYSQTIVVDSSPGLWDSPQGSEKTPVLLLVDPHCSYRISISVSFSAAAGRFLLLYWSQIIGISFAIVFFALMQQAKSWEVDLPVPSMLAALESNLRMPLPSLYLAVSPILIALCYSFSSSQPSPSAISFIIISIICYLFANGIIIMLILISQFVFYVAASIHVLIRTRWQWETNLLSFKVVRIMRLNPLLVTALPAMALVCFVHPAFGLFILLLSDALCCHIALSSFLTASFRSHARSEQLFDFGDGGNRGNSRTNKGLPANDHNSNSPDSAKSYGETQLEIFHHQLGLLTLHLAATLMFVPSLVAWFQRIGGDQSFPWFLDSALTMGIILHGVCGAKPEHSFWFPLPGSTLWEVKQSFAYLIAAFTCFLSGLALAPYRAFYAMASIGIMSLAFRIRERRIRALGEAYYNNRKHSHRH